MRYGKISKYETNCIQQSNRYFPSNIFSRNILRRWTLFVLHWERFFECPYFFIPLTIFEDFFIPLPNLLFFIPLQHRNLPDLLFIRIIFVLYYIFKTSSTNPSLNPNAIIAFQNFHISSFNGGSERGTNPAIPQKVCAKPAIR